MVTSPYELKIHEWDEKPQTNFKKEGVKNILDVVVNGRNEEKHDIKLCCRDSSTRDWHSTVKCEFKMNKAAYNLHLRLASHQLIEVKEPTNATEARSFMGLVNFSKRYNAKANVVEALRRLTQRSLYLWKELKHSFETLKSWLIRFYTHRGLARLVRNV